jgi:uncharacterized protein (DUF1330 family)
VPIHPNDEQRRAYQDIPDNVPIYMLNLLKYRDKAKYDNPNESEKTMSGYEAYQAYGRVAIKCVSEVGGKVVFAGSPKLLLIGTAGDFPYDDVIVVEYPSKQAFSALQRLPAFQAAMRHRSAGLDYQILELCVKLKTKNLAW